MRSRKLISTVLISAMLLTGCSSVCESTHTQDDESISNMLEGGIEPEYEMNDMADVTAEELYLGEQKSDFNTEEYKSLKENDFISVKKNSVSTFSADVDTASYSNVRRMIEQGYIDPDAVRTEEFINYFKYDYEQPTNDEPFKANTEIMDCPWNEDAKLLSVGIKAKEINYEKLPDSNLVFLLDVSGSMYDDNKLPLMVKSFEMLSENLSEKDMISIVTYAGNDEVLLEGASGADKDKINSALESLEAGGGTNGAAGIETAYELARKYFIEGGNNRVILATDGDLNIGLSSDEELEGLITQKAKSGVFLSVLGLGMGNYKDSKMETLADKGNGNYAYIDSVLEARKVLVEELGGTLFTVAKDVKFQVEFNQDKIKEYRLIGYENRMLNEEDFEDDKKDAGEIGAGHCVTALYEFIPTESDTDIDKANGEDELLKVNIRYKEPDGKKSKLLTYPVTETQYKIEPSDNIKFASCVAQFGMLLRQSKYAGSSSYEGIQQQLSRLDSVSQDMYKQQFGSLVEQASKITLIEGEY